MKRDDGLGLGRSFIEEFDMRGGGRFTYIKRERMWTHTPPTFRLKLSGKLPRTLAAELIRRVAKAGRGPVSSSSAQTRFHDGFVASSSSAR